MRMLKFCFVLIIISIPLFGWGGKSTLKELLKFQE